MNKVLGLCKQTQRFYVLSSELDFDSILLVNSVLTKAPESVKLTGFKASSMMWNDREAHTLTMELVEHAAITTGRKVQYKGSISIPSQDGSWRVWFDTVDIDELWEINKDLL